MGKLTRIVLLSAAVAAVGMLQTRPAHAADASAKVGEVVVKGQRPPKTPERFSTTVRKFVASHAPASPAGTLARWMGPICPATTGLSGAFDAFVNQRIAEVSARVGAPGPKHCHDVNVLVVFTAEPQKLMDLIRDKNPGLLGFHHLVEEKQLATFEGPIKAMHVTGSRWAATGVTSIDDPSANDGNKDKDVAGQAPTRVVLDQSRLKIDRADEFMSSVVVVDSTAVEGQSIGAIADRIAVEVLSDQGHRKGCSPLPSLVDALDGACPASASVETLTAFDEGFLKGLYSSNPEQVLQAERGMIARRILKETGPSDASTNGAANAVAPSSSPTRRPEGRTTSSAD